MEVESLDYSLGGTMSGSIIHTVNKGEDWEVTWPQVEYARKGKLGLSLTNYDNDSLPAIASGSWAEVVGSIYKWTSEEAISGSLTANAINYIKLVPGGSGDSAYVTATWTDTPPTWSDAYQGWYDGTSRYVAGCYYDGTYYLLKWIYYDRDTFLIVKWFNATFISTRVLADDTLYAMNQVMADGLCLEAGYWMTTGAGLGAGGYAKLYQEAKDGTTNEMCALGATEGSTTTIAYPVINNDDYSYYWTVLNKAGAMQGIVLKTKVAVWNR